MKEMEMHKVAEEKAVLVSVKCDWCGKVLYKKGEERFDPGIWHDGANFSVYFGYGSRFDTRTYHFDICDDCFEKEFKSKASKRIDYL